VIFGNITFVNTTVILDIAHFVNLVSMDDIYVYDNTPAQTNLPQVYDLCSECDCRLTHCPDWGHSFVPSVCKNAMLVPEFRIDSFQIGCDTVINYYSKIGLSVVRWGGRDGVFGIYRPKGSGFVTGRK